MTKQNTNFLIVILVIVLGMIIIGWNSDKKMSAGNDPDNKMIKTEKFERKFVEGCTTSPDMRDYCECFYQEFEKSYTDEEILEIAEKHKNGGIKAMLESRKLKGSLVNCYNELPNK